MSIHLITQLKKTIILIIIIVKLKMLKPNYLFNLALTFEKANADLFQGLI